FDNRETLCVLLLSFSCCVSDRHLSSQVAVASQSAASPLHSAAAQVVPTRNFLNLLTPLIARRIQYRENRTIGYSVEQIYSIVANIEQYQQFVPWCRKSKVTKGRSGNVRALLEIGFPPLVERYVSEVSVIPNQQIRAVCTDGSLFSHLETLWRFTSDLGSQSDSCNVAFYVTFEFKSLMHSQLATVFLDEVVKQMVGAFEKRAATLHGPCVHSLETTSTASTSSRAA
ncbi:hypothetical protein P4O66_007878, partial [Electrophorus voltai]